MYVIIFCIVLALASLAPAVLSDDRSIYREVVCPAMCPGCSESECEPKAPGPITQVSVGRNGRLPDELGQLTSLENLSCDSCNLTGSIPSSLGSLPKLSTVWLNNNRISGTIPASLFDSTSLHILSLPHNQLTGTLPSNLGLGGASLDELYVSHNMLSGNVPEGITHMADTLYDLFLDHNQFSGPLNASVLGQLVNLDNLLLGHNQFDPPVPWAAISAMQQLQRLDLSGMTTYAGLELNGTALGAVALSELNLSGCGFEGPVPSELANMGGSLFSLNLADNRLDHLPDLSGLTGLSDFVLRNNSFHQRWPDSMAKMSSLGMVDFSHNEFYGHLPFMPNLINLGEFDASHNLLSGSLDFIGLHWENLGELRLNDNLFNGSLPASLVNLQYLSVLHVSHNQFTGPIPDGLTVIDDVEPGQCNLFDSGAAASGHRATQNCFDCASLTDPSNPCFIPECATRVVSCNASETVPNRLTAQSHAPVSQSHATDAATVGSTKSSGSHAVPRHTTELHSTSAAGATSNAPISATLLGTAAPSRAPSPSPAPQSQQGTPATDDSPSTNMIPAQQPAPNSEQFSAVGPILGTLAVVVVLAAGAFLFKRWRSTRPAHSFQMLGVGSDMMPLEDDVQLVEEDQISETPPVRSSHHSSSGHRRKRRN